jgi:hypothetical protein
MYVCSVQPEYFEKMIAGPDTEWSEWRKGRKQTRNWQANTRTKTKQKINERNNESIQFYDDNTI